jgi:hypothetical protein
MFARILIVSLVSLKCSTATFASVLFINPDGPERFDWAGDGSPQSWLDITRPWDEQPGINAGGSSINQESLLHLGQLSGNPAAIAFHINSVEGLPFLAPVEAVPFSQGDPDQFTWNYTGLSFSDGLGSLLPEGEQTTIGLRFELDSADHYGWIRVVRTGTGLDALGWGYDTEPGSIPFAPIIPEPASILFLGLGFAIAAGKKRN